MSFDLPGNRTDRLVAFDETSFTEATGCLVADTPGLPVSNWGHRLVLERDPGDATPAWFVRWMDEHDGKGVETAYLTFEDREIEAGGGACNLRLGTLAAAAAPDGVELRELGPGEWSALVELYVALENEKIRPYAEILAACRAAQVEAGTARQFGAFVDGELVGVAALFEDGQDARYQDVQVKEAFRRRGIAAALVSRLAEGASAPAVWINAVRGEGAERIYRRLGFEPVTRQRWWSIKRPLREAELLRRWGHLRDSTISPDDWRHSDHLWGAVLAVDEWGDGALSEFGGVLRRLLESLGIETTETSGYHETMTAGWLRIVAAQRRRFGGDSLEEAVIRARLDYGDKKYLLRHWSRDALMSFDARHGWLEPDLEPLPQ